jgi:hypothetical protein
MTAITFDLLTNDTGKLRREITPEDIEALEPNQLAALSAATDAADMLDDLTAKLDAQVSLTKGMAFDFDKKRLHLLHVQPPVTALSMQRLMAKSDQERMRLARIPVDPAITEAIEAAGQSEQRFEEAKQNLRQLQGDLLQARSVVAAKIHTFQNTFIPMTPSDLIRQHLKAEQQRKIDGVNARPDEAPPATPLDAYLKSSRGPLGIRSARQSQRGAYPASMRGQRVAPPVAALTPWKTRPMGPRQ